MKHKQLLALFLFTVMILSSKIVENNVKDVRVKNVSSSVSKYEIKNISEENEIEKIEVYYPYTKYDNINEIIKRKIEYYISKFKSEQKVEDKKNLFISFEEYEYNDYTSFKFKIKSNTNMIHGNEYYFTLTYKGSEIVDIYSLINKDKDILNKLHDIAYSELSNNEKIKEYSNKVLLEKGLEKNVDNYSNFIFTKEAFILIFNEDTIAPNVAGPFEIKIPYTKL